MARTVTAHGRASVALRAALRARGHRPRGRARTRARLRTDPFPGGPRVSIVELRYRVDCDDLGEELPRLRVDYRRHARHLVLVRFLARLPEGIGPQDAEGWTRVGHPTRHYLGVVRAGYDPQEAADIVDVSIEVG